MKYFVYLNTKDNDSMVKQSFLLLKHLYSVNDNRFYSNLMNLIEQYDSCVCVYLFISFPLNGF